MKAFYSILYTSVRPIAKEQLSIGFFMFDGTKSFFHFSNEKVNLTKRLLTESSFVMLKNYLEGLRRDIQISGHEKGFSNISPDYFNYLSNYSNNLISFSKPTSIDVELSQDNFEKLFEKFVFNYEKIQTIQEHQNKGFSLEFARKQLYPKIKERVNLNQVLTPKEVPHLVIPKVKVDFIGKNDSPVAGGAINFESGIGSLSNNISHFVTLISALHKGKKDGQYYLIGEEPKKKEFPEQHATWKQVHQSNLIDFVPLNEIEKVSTYMNKHKVKPFLKE